MADAAQIAEHIPRLRRYARALERDPTRADDLVQDTLERALRKFSLWQSHGDLRAWLFTIMHNVFLNHVRSRGAQPVSVTLDDTSEQISGLSSHEDSLQVRDVLSALQLLPSEFRSVVVLVGLEELSYEEAARVLGVPKGTVMSRLARGREKLAAIMAGEAVPMLRRVK